MKKDRSDAVCSGLGTGMGSCESQLATGHREPRGTYLGVGRNIPSRDCERDYDGAEHDGPNLRPQEEPFSLIGRDTIESSQWIYIAMNINSAEGEQDSVEVASDDFDPLRRGGNDQDTERESIKLVGVQELTAWAT